MIGSQIVEYGAILREGLWQMERMQSRAVLSHHVWLSNELMQLLAARFHRVLMHSSFEILSRVLFLFQIMNPLSALCQGVAIAILLL